MNANPQKLTQRTPGTATEPVSGVSWLHRFAALVVVLVFFAIVLSSRELGAVSYARLALTFRNVAAVAAVLLACWIWLSPSPTYLKVIGTIAAVLGVAATLGAGRNSFAATLAETSLQPVLEYGFYSLTVSAVLFTRTDWRWDEAKTVDLAAPSFRQLSVVTTAMIFIESVFGAAYASDTLRLAPHMILGILTAAAALWMLEMALNKFSHVRELKIAAILTGELVVLQIFLGLVTYSMTLNAQAEARPIPGMAVIGPTHAAAAALALAASLFTVLEAFKYLSPRVRRTASGTN